jgi:hypothetical protein
MHISITSGKGSESKDESYDALFDATLLRREC